MGIEIERKFVVPNLESTTIKYESIKKTKQGYLDKVPNVTVRAYTYEGKGYIAIKDSSSVINRGNWEYEIPIKDAEELVVYLENPDTATRRIRTMDNEGILTIKEKAGGMKRKEWEYSITFDDALELLSKCPAVIEKTRCYVQHDGMTWEVDIFHSVNEGLVIAEVEFDNLEQHIELPDWVGKEVTNDERYYNSYLARHPYTTW